MLKHK